MRQIIEYCSYLSEAFRLWRKAQYRKFLIWLGEKTNCTLIEGKRYVTLAKAQGASFLRIASMKLIYKIVTKLDELLTRGN